MKSDELKRNEEKVMNCLKSWKKADKNYSEVVNEFRRRKNKLAKIYEYYASKDLGNWDKERCIEYLYQDYDRKDFTDADIEDVLGRERSTLWHLIKKNSDCIKLGVDFEECLTKSLIID
ncbi:hypothetical protein [uncultured Clostridium sp.]|uniref:hypothetical protein n=1 Tax=uncultured Clostridium sp. TaxID=59620 RepID=UPI0025D1AE1F|nr:hypothetical protein [uncultured Clostridium sp.]